ncbi:MAG TPA: histidine kinase [Albitalea sp.]|uniref:histidine kinase n=1 Tax=Piscinibacter sp. TaxID=1903157 RepID=UPI002ED1DD9C
MRGSPLRTPARWDLAGRVVAALRQPRLEPARCALMCAAIQSMVMALYACIGEVPWVLVLAFLVVSIGSALAFVATVRWNTRLSDEGLVQGQVYANCAVQLAFLMLAPQLWFLFTTALCLIYAHAMTRFRPRQFTMAWLVIGIGLGLALYSVRGRLAHPGTGWVDVFLLWLCIFLGIRQIMRIGVQFNSLRITLSERRRELAVSLLQVEALAGERRLAERERAARELHDSLLQGLQGLMLRLQSATERIPPQEPARRMMEEALERGDQLLLDGCNGHEKLRWAGPAGLPDAPAAGDEAQP